MTLLMRLRALGYRASKVGKEIYTNAPDRRQIAEGACLVPYGPCDQANMFPRTPAWPNFGPSESAKPLDMSPRQDLRNALSTETMRALFPDEAW